MSTATRAANAASNDEPSVDTLQLIGWLAMVMGMFLAILDIQIVASSLNEIQAGLAASPDEISWIQTAYLIAEVIMIPLSGYLARMWGSRRLFVISAIGFTLSSLACAFAWSLESLVAMRVVQGFIGGGMIPCVFTSVYLIFPPSRQPAANVAVGMIVTTASAIGPTLGGFITETLSWHWLFLLNVVPGLVVITLVSAMRDFDSADPSLAKGLDIIGLLAMALFLGGMEFVLDEGPRDDWFDAPLISAWTAISAAAGMLFLWRCFKQPSPIVNLRVYANRNFALGSLMAAVMGMGLFGAVYITPLFLARIQGYNALQIGTVMSVTGIFMFMTAPLAGKLAQAIGPRWVMAGGCLLAATGILSAGHFTAEAAYDQFFWPQAIRGIGLVSIIITLNGIALGTLPASQLSNASGLYNLARNMGGAIGLAVINTLLDSRDHLHMARLSDWLNPARPEYQQHMERLLAQGHSTGSALATTRQLLERQAQVMTFNDIHPLMGCCFLLTLFLIPWMRPAQGKTAEH